MKAFIVHAWLLSGSCSNVEVLDIISKYKDFDFDLDIMASPNFSIGQKIGQISRKSQILR